MKVTKIILLTTLGLLLTSCQDWNYQRVSFLEVRTRDASEVTANTAILAGTLIGLIDGETVSQHGHVWSSETEEPTLDDYEGKTELNQQGNVSYTSSTTSSTSDVKALRPNTRYYYRAYAVFREKPVYGEVGAFTTGDFALATDPAGAVSIEWDCAIVTWRLVGYLGDPERLGVVWSATSEAPTLDGEAVKQTGQTAPPLNCSITPCPITDSLCTLEPNTNYYLRPYLLPGDGQPPVYGEVVYFHTFPEHVGWRRLRDFEGGARNTAAVFIIEERAFIGGGGNNQGIYDDFWEYDPDSDNWIRKGSIPIPVHLFADLVFYFSLGSRGYLMIGDQGKPIEFWSYDPKSGWHPLTKPDISLQGGNIISIKDRGYYIDRDLNVLEFDPEKADEDQWRVVDTLPLPGGFIGAAGEKGYLFADGTWEFDPLAPQGERFREMDDFPGQSFSVAFALNAKIYAGLGSFPGNFGWSYPRELWEFDPNAPAGAQWRRMPDFWGPGRTRATAFSLGGKGYVFAGRLELQDGATHFKDLWEFTPPE